MGDFLEPPHGTKQAAVLINKNIHMSSFESSDKIEKVESGPCCTISDNESPSVTLNK